MGRSGEDCAADRDLDRTDVDAGRRGRPSHLPAMDCHWSEVMIARLSWPRTVTFKKEPWGWMAGGVASLLFFLFLTFPFGTLQARVLSELVRATGWDIRAAEWSPALPLAVEWRDVTWTKPGSAGIPIQLMRIN